MLEPVWPTTTGRRFVASLLSTSGMVMLVLSVWTLWVVFTSDIHLLPVEYQQDFVQFAKVIAGVAATGFYTSIAIFIGLDAAKLGVRRGQLGPVFADIGPFAWFLYLQLSHF